LGNLQRLFQGQKEFPLSDDGREQAQSIAETLSKNGRIYQKIIASPQERALETAQIIADRLNLKLDIEPLWKEVDNGLLAGLTREEADERQIIRGDLTNPFFPLGEHGESWWELYIRSGKALHHLLENPPGSYLVVAHGGVLNAALRSVLGLAPQPGGFTPTFHFKNTSSTTLRFDAADQRWQFLSLSQTPLP
jgi:broad specificity phosphatase PhoE